MEVKILCHCGTKYKFDVEPVNGQMPGPIMCPSCGSEGTAAANQSLAQQLPRAATPTARPIVIVPSGGPPPPPPPTAARLSVSGVAAAASNAAEASPSPPPPPSHVAPVVPQASRPPIRRAEAPQRPKSNLGEPRFMMGVIGAVVGGLIGMIGWYVLIKTTGRGFGYAALGVGAITGFGARTLAGGGTFGLGIVASLCAWLAIVGGLYQAFNSAVDSVLKVALDGAYEERVEYAKKATAAISDDDLRKLLAEEEAEFGMAPDPSIVTSTELAEFRSKELPALRDIVKGKPPKAEFEANLRKEIKEEIKVSDIFKRSMGLFTIVWLVIGVGAAYKIGASD